MIDYSLKILFYLWFSTIAGDRNFDNLTRIWLNGDHYKWRAMRANGIVERFITGNAADYEKFEAWAATVPRTLRNPLYLWTHLELKRCFGIGAKILNPATAREIYDACSEMLQSEAFSTRNILSRMNVKLLCTTDDPVDDLSHHRELNSDQSFEIYWAMTWRTVNCPMTWNCWAGWSKTYVITMPSITSNSIEWFRNLGIGELWN
jgi:glucuronate isomerase